MCKMFVGDVPNLSSGVEYVSVVKSVISVVIYDSFILGGIGWGWDRTWEARGFYCPWFDDGRIDCNFWWLLIIKW